LKITWMAARARIKKRVRSSNCPWWH